LQDSVAQEHGSLQVLVSAVKMPPNPSIEGTHKRLRLFRSTHVKR
jgi:hypothetical protein